jgi:hypothetical protein
MYGSQSTSYRRKRRWTRWRTGPWGLRRRFSSTVSVRVSIGQLGLADLVPDLVVLEPALEEALEAVLAARHLHRVEPSIGQVGERAGVRRVARPGADAAETVLFGHELEGASRGDASS